MTATAPALCPHRLVMSYRHADETVPGGHEVTYACILAPHDAEVRHRHDLLGTAVEWRTETAEADTGPGALPASVRAAGPDLIAWLWSASQTAAGRRGGASVSKALATAAAVLEQDLGVSPFAATNTEDGGV